MSAATQQAPTEDRPRRRLTILPRTRKGRVGAVAGLLALAAGTAYALYVFVLGISGTVAGGTFVPTWVVGQTTVSSANDMTCTADAAGGAVTISAANGYPGSSCVFDGAAKVTTTSTESGRVIGMEATGMPAGWSLALEPGECGKTLNTTTNTSVLYRVSIDPGATNYAGGALPSGIGLKVVPASQFDTGLCS